MFTKEELDQVNEHLKTVPVKGKDYAPVTERVKAFRSICPTGTITTEIVSLGDGVVVMKATIADGDLVLGTGLAYEKESSSYINKTSYIENCETSAVGRALGFCGIGIDASMASAEELANALKQQEDMKVKNDISNQPIGDIKAAALEKMLEKAGQDVQAFLDHFKVESASELTEAQHLVILKGLEKKGEK